MHFKSTFVGTLALAATVAASPLIASRAAAAAASPDGWSYVSCYTEATGVRALTSDSYFADDLTVQICANYCANIPNSNYKYFGVEYGRYY